jgi:hypothetical protein
MGRSRSSQGPPPPGVLRPTHRNINPGGDSSVQQFNSSPAPGQQLFPSQSDPLTNISSSFGGLNLTGGGGGNNPPSGVQGFAYSSQQQTPGSPSRLLGPGFNSQQQQNPGAAAAAVSSSSYPMLSGLGPNTGAPNVAAVSAALMGGGMNTPMGMLGGGRLGGGGSANLQGGPGGSQQANGGGPVDKRSGLPDAGLLFTEMQGEISKEAEDEANNYFHRIYSKPPVRTISK